MQTLPQRHLMILGVSVSLLFIILSFPFNYDQTIFMVGGEKIVLHGGIPFKDVLDTKPLMIMYLYGFSSALFGHSMVSVRILDLLFQLASLFFVYRIALRIFKDGELAPWAVFLYSLLYVTFDYTATAQAETFALLPALYITDVVTRSFPERRVTRVFLTSILIAIASVFIVLLKASLIVIPIGLLGFLLLKKDIKERIRFIAIISIISLLLLSGYVYYLYISGATENMLSAFTWLSDYSSAKNSDVQTTVSNWALQELPKNYTTIYSFTTLILLGMGIYVSLKELRTSTGSVLWQDNSYIYLFICIFALCFATIVYERKFFGYSFTRLLFCSLPFIILPLINTIDTLNRSKYTDSLSVANHWWLKAFMRITIVSVVLFFSPLYSLGDRGIRRIILSVEGEDVLADLKTTDRFNTIAEQRNLSDKLRSFIKPDDTIFIWGNHIGPYYFLGKTPPTMIITSVMAISPWTPTQWKEQVIQELKANMPNCLLIEHYDYADVITGYKLDSFRGMIKWKDFSDLILANYDSTTTTHSFTIYTRKQR